MKNHAKAQTSATPARPSLWLSLALLIALTVGIATQRPAYGETLQLVTGTDYAPYTSPELPNGGVITETVTRVFHEMGVETNLQYYPWKRGYQRVVSGSSDITFPYAKSKNRERQVLYSHPVNRIAIRLYYNIQAPVSFDQPDDLAGLTYCEPLGYQTEPLLEDLIAAGNVTRLEAQTMDNCFQLLAKLQVDFLATNDLVAHAAGQRIAGQRAPALFAGTEKPINISFEYVIASKQNPKAATLIARFNKAYQDLLDRGVIQEIWQRHLGDAIKPPS